jgi:hypothetical protein
MQPQKGREARISRRAHGMLMRDMGRRSEECDPDLRCFNDLCKGFIVRDGKKRKKGGEEGREGGRKEGREEGRKGGREAGHIPMLYRLLNEVSHFR